MRTLQRTVRLRTNTEIGNKYSQKRNCGPQSQFPHSCVCERFIYSHDRSAYSADRSWEYRNRSQTHECGNWDWGRTIPWRGIHKWDFRYSVATWYIIVQYVFQDNSQRINNSPMSTLLKFPNRQFLQSYEFYHCYFTQCASDSFRITPSYYSLYLDPVERNRELQISWVSLINSVLHSYACIFIILIKNKTRSGIAKWV